MKRIRKSLPEPRALQEHRLRGSSFDDLPKEAVRTRLVTDQRGLCCYCMRRIEDHPLQVKIEHFRGQYENPALTLDWSNLFAACIGGQGLPPRLQHCDTAKGSRPCSLDPLTIDESRITYGSDGTIRHEDPMLDAQLNAVLNLNAPSLRAQRKRTLEAYLKARSLRKQGSWTRASLQREVESLLSRDPLDPFCMVVVAWLRDRIRRG